MTSSGTAVRIEQGGGDDCVKGALARVNPLGWPGGSTRPEPRFCSMNPVAGHDHLGAEPA